MKKGWEYKTLGDICDILDYLRKPVTKRDRVAGNIPYYGATGCLDYVNEYIFDEKLVLLGEDGAKWAAGEKSSFIVNGKTWINNHAHVLRPHREYIQDEFMSIFLNYADLSPFITGVTVPKLNQAKMKTIPIPVPPLSEQEEIVSRLDRAFEKIDTLRRNAEKSLTTAQQLFQSTLSHLLTPQPHWERKTLGEISEDMYRGTGIKRNEITNNGTPCLRYGEIYTTYNYSFDKCISHTDINKIKSQKYFEHGDLLFAITGESVEDIGKTIAYTGHEKCLLGGDIVCMKHSQNPQYLAYALSTADAIRQKGKGKVKLKVVHTSIPAIKEIEIPIPPLPEQTAIVAKLDSLSAKVKQLKDNYTRTVALCDEMKQALLKEVFE